MSVIRLRADLAFAEKDIGEATKLLAQLQGLEAKLVNVNGARTDVRREPSQVVVHRCYHEEPGDRPCEVLSAYEKPEARDARPAL